MQRIAMMAALALPLMLGACTGGGPHTANADGASVTAIGAALDDFHDAASKADGPRYFAHFAPEGVFIGTDATERWTVTEFRAYAEPYFSKGKGWTYRCTQRHVDLVVSDASVAYFDELLQNEKFGVCRGSGVLRKSNGVWLICQYHLTVPVPNDLLPKVADMIRAAK